jgi:hypothetical protein
LLVYSRHNTTVIPMDDYDNKFNQHCRFSTGTRRDSLNIILACRPPSCVRENDDKLIEIIRLADENTLLIGDINMPDIDWATGRTDAKGRDLLEAVEEQNMEQLVRFSTHSKGNTLDLVITNCPERVVSISNEGRLGKSDHCIY